MHALVVEDDAISRIALVTKLQVYGLDISEVDNGEDAVLAVDAVLEEDRQFDLICLDINLPGINGEEVLRKIRQLEGDNNLAEESRAKVMMVTSVKDIERITNAFEIQCDGYLTKPVSMESVKTHLEQLGLITVDCNA